MRDVTWFSEFLPFRTASGAQRFDFLFFSQAGKDAADQIQPDPGTFSPEVRDAEGGDLAVNSSEDSLGFFASRRLELADALLEFLASLGEDEEQEIYRGPGVVFALMPALGGKFEDFVVTFFVLFDQAFEADIAAGLNAAMIAGEQK